MKNSVKSVDCSSSQCPNDDSSNFVCLYWKYSIPQKHCWLASIRGYSDVHCLVEDNDTWFKKLFIL